ncbi:hypothetical protein SAMD00019534_075890, partial [Acytostelium subglobosum LB1]|uniref:hypothetical protein n=1 Tax=Acytostelium subglobosum LB1 TaxID=1410327 RepID=UPI0006449978
QQQQHQTTLHLLDHYTIIHPIQSNPFHTSPKCLIQSTQSLPISTHNSQSQLNPNNTIIQSFVKRQSRPYYNLKVIHDKLIYNLKIIIIKTLVFDDISYSIQSPIFIPDILGNIPSESLTVHWTLPSIKSSQSTTLTLFKSIEILSLF